MSADTPAEMEIGKVLEEGRRRAGLDIRTLEEQTKIRIKYLRALENEQWDLLPSPAYAKGFLRTYAEHVGLDGEALVDEFRRQVEGGRGSVSYPLGEKVLERRRRPGEEATGPRPGLLLAAAIAIVIAVLAVLGLTGGDEDPAREGRQGEGKRGGAAGGDGKRSDSERKGEADQEPFTLQLAIGSAVEVCLLDGGERELIDGQVLAAGSEEGPWEAERFELRFPSGYDRAEVELAVNGESERLPRRQEPAAFEITAPGRVKPAKPPGLGCP